MFEILRLTLGWVLPVIIITNKFQFFHAINLQIYTVDGAGEDWGWWVSGVEAAGLWQQSHCWMQCCVGHEGCRM